MLSDITDINIIVNNFKSKLIVEKFHMVVVIYYVVFLFEMNNFIHVQVLMSKICYIYYKNKGLF